MKQNKLKLLAVIAVILACLFTSSCIKIEFTTGNPGQTAPTPVEESTVKETEPETEKATEKETEAEKVTEKETEPEAEKVTEKEKETETEKESEKVTENRYNDIDFEVLHCVFTDKLYPSDKECVEQYYYDDESGKVYVDLALKIVNNNNILSFGKIDVSGYFIYDDLRHDMSFVYENSSGTSVHLPEGKNSMFNVEGVPYGRAGVVHLAAMVDADAQNEDITVTYKIRGKEYTEKVKAASSNVLSGKTEVKVGDKLDVNGLFDIEIISCKQKSYLTAYDVANSEQYEPIEAGKDFFELLIKVKNNSIVNLEELFAYSIIDGEAQAAISQIETYPIGSTNKKILADFDSTFNYIGRGKETYVHIYTTVDKDTDTSELAMRFNLGGERFYCPISK